MQEINIIGRNVPSTGGITYLQADSLLSAPYDFAGTGMGKNWRWGYSSGSGGSLSWEWDYRLEPEEKGEIQVLVNYMTELKRIDVPVDLKFGLSGMVRETSRQRKP